MAKQSKAKKVNREISGPTDFLGNPLTRERLLAMLDLDRAQREGAYRAVRSGKVSGHIGHDSVTIYMGPSSVTYNRYSTTYGF